MNAPTPKPSPAAPVAKGDAVKCVSTRPALSRVAGETGVVTDVFADGAIIRVRWTNLRQNQRGEPYVSDIGACSLVRA